MPVVVYRLRTDCGWCPASVSLTSGPYLLSYAVGYGLIAMSVNCYQYQNYLYRMVIGSVNVMDVYLLAGDIVGVTFNVLPDSIYWQYYPMSMMRTTNCQLQGYIWYCDVEWVTVNIPAIFSDAYSRPVGYLLSGMYNNKCTMPTSIPQGQRVSLANKTMPDSYDISVNMYPDNCCPAPSQTVTKYSVVYNIDFQYPESAVVARASYKSVYSTVQVVGYTPMQIEMFGVG